MTAGQNPFRASRIHALPFLWPQGESWETLEARWREQGFKGALVGSHGNGKSTLLEEWMPRLEARGWSCQLLRLTEEAPRLPAGFRLAPAPAGRRRCLLLDGAEQLGFRGWQRFRRLTRRAEGLILTSHRPGRLPTLLDFQTDPARLASLLNTLLDGDLSRLPASPAALLAGHHQDVRLVFRHLYDVFSCNFPKKRVE